MIMFVLKSHNVYAQWYSYLHIAAAMTSVTMYMLQKKIKEYNVSKVSHCISLTNLLMLY
jgi:hypothetical protein